MDIRKGSHYLDPERVHQCVVQDFHFEGVQRINNFPSLSDRNQHPLTADSPGLFDICGLVCELESPVKTAYKSITVIINAAYQHAELWV